MVLLPQRPALVALASAAVLAHLTLARAWPALKPVRWLLVPLAVFSLGVWSWTAQGPSHLFWRVSRESLAFGAANFLKLATMMVAGLILLATTPAEELFVGLVKLRLPYAGAFAFALALRWVPEIFATVNRVKEAQEARGLAWEQGSLLERLRRHLPLLVPIFLLTLRAQPDHGLGPGGPGLSDEPAAELSSGDSDAAPGLAGPGRGRGVVGSVYCGAYLGLGPDSRIEIVSSEQCGRLEPVWPH